MALPWPGLLWEITVMEWLNMIDMCGDKKKMNTHETCNCSKRHWDGRINQTKWYLLEKPVQPFVQHDCYFRVRRKWKRDRDFSEPFVGIEFDIVLDPLMIFQKQETRGTVKWSPPEVKVRTLLTHEIKSSSLQICTTNRVQCAGSVFRSGTYLEEVRVW